MKPIYIAVSPGELVDRISILELKARRFKGPKQAQHAREQLQCLFRTLRNSGELLRFAKEFRKDLGRINRELWDMENAIRRCERRGDFGEGFVAVARRICTLNDRRASLKQALDRELGFNGEYKDYR